MLVSFASIEKMSYYRSFVSLRFDIVAIALRIPDPLPFLPLDPGWIKYIDPDCRDRVILRMHTWKCVRQNNVLIGPSMVRALGPNWLPNSYNSKGISKLYHSTYRYQ